MYFTLIGESATLRMMVLNKIGIHVAVKGKYKYLKGRRMHLNLKRLRIRSQREMTLNQSDICQYCWVVNNTDFGARLSGFGSWLHCSLILCLLFLLCKMGITVVSA